MNMDPQSVFARAEAQLESTGYPPLLTDSLWDSDTLASFALTRADEVYEHLPPHDPLNFAHTAATANLIYQLRRTGAIGTLAGELSANFVLLARLRALLAGYREHFPPEDVPTLRWHLHAAGCISDLQAILDIGSSWQSVNGHASSIHLIAHSLFWLLTDLTAEEPWPTRLWAGDMSAEEDAEICEMFAEVMTSLRATDVMRAPGFMNPNPDWAKGFVEELTDDTQHPICEWWSPEELLPVLQDAPRRCISYLKLVPPRELDGRQSLLAIEGWCECALGELETAPERFVAAANLFTKAAKASTREDATFHVAAAHCFGKANKFPEAEAQAREWVRLSPDDPNARKRLSEFLYKQNRFSEAVEAWADFVSRSDESAGEDWSASLLLKLGLESLTSQQLTVAIESAAQSSIFKEQGQALAEWLTPWTDGLVRRAADRWWTGLFVLTQETLHRNLGSAAVYEVAGSRFGEAVTAQLEECVAKPFGATLPVDLKSRFDDDQSKLYDDWKRFIRLKATLGQQLILLVHSCAPQGPNKDLSDRLQKWMAANTPGLSKYICQKGMGVMTLSRLRGDATHGEITLKDLRILFDEASALLRTVRARKEIGESAP